MKPVLKITLLGLTLLLPSGPLAQDETGQTHPPVEESYRAFVAPDGVQHVSVVGGNYFFRPNHIIVHANAPVELGVTLERGMIPHSLVIDAPEAGMQVDEKLSTELKKIHFTPTAAGKYAFYCKHKLLFLKSHRDKGMEGTLEVIE